MTDVLNLIQTTLEALGIPTAPVTLVCEQLPDSFIVWTLVSNPRQFADDDETLREYQVNVSVFSRFGLHDLPDVDGAMKAAGFIKGSERMESYSMHEGYFHLIKSFTYYDQA